MSTAVRRAFWLLPAAGILTLLPWFHFIHVEAGQQHVAGDEAMRAASLGDQVATYAYVAGFLCLLFGLLALNAYVASRRQGVVSVVAIALDLLAVAFMVSIQVGIVALARPMAAEFYLSGHQDSGPLVLQLSGGSFGSRIIAFLGVTIVVALAGAIATGVAIWRSGVLPRWAAVLIAAGFVLTMTDAPLIGWVGSGLLLGAGSWIAWVATRAATATVTHARVEPGVEA